MKEEQTVKTITVVKYYNSTTIVVMSNKKTTIDSFFDEVWARIKSETQIRNMGALAEIAGTTQQNVSKKKKEKKFPIEWAYRVAQQFGLLTEWLVTGKGPTRLGGTCTQPDQEKKKTGIIEEWLQEVRTKEGHDGRIIMELTLQVPEFRDWFKEKKSKAPLAENSNPRKNVA